MKSLRLRVGPKGDISMKTFGETARELVFGSRLRKTRVLLAIAGSVVLAACPEEDLTFGEEPSVDIPIVDTTPPTFTLLDFPNILSEGIKNLRIRVTDQQGASGVDRNSFMITSCSSGVTATISGDEVIENSPEVVDQLINGDEVS